jgi:hypothetical protein
LHTFLSLAIALTAVDDEQAGKCAKYAWGKNQHQHQKTSNFFYTPPNMPIATTAYTQTPN